MDKVVVALAVIILGTFFYISQQAVMCATDPFQYGAKVWEKETNQNVTGYVYFINDTVDFDRDNWRIKFDKGGSTFPGQYQDINYTINYTDIIAEQVEKTNLSYTEMQDVNLSEEFIKEIENANRFLYS